MLRSIRHRSSYRHSNRYHSNRQHIRRIPRSNRCHSSHRRNNRQNIRRTFHNSNMAQRSRIRNHFQALCLANQNQNSGLSDKRLR